MEYQKRYEDLLRSFRGLQRRNDDLQKELEKITNILDDSKARVRELVPLEQARNRMYDEFVTTGSGDPCFSAGMSGKCGPDCSIYGSKPECPEG